MRGKYIIGIDEVGRGALAGPVTVCAVAIPKNLGIPPSLKLRRAGRIYNLGKLRDSKQLTKLQRERWNEYIRNHPKISYALARVYPRGIEKMNISNAANRAALRAYTRLIAKRKAHIVIRNRPCI